MARHAPPFSSFEIKKEQSCTQSHVKRELATMSATRDLSCCLVAWRGKENQPINFEYACKKRFRDCVCSTSLKESVIDRPILKSMVGLNAAMKDVVDAAVEAEYITRKREVYNYEAPGEACSGAFLLDAVVARLKFYEAKLVHHQHAVKAIKEDRSKGRLRPFAMYTMDKVDGQLIDAVARVIKSTDSSHETALEDVVDGASDQGPRRPIEEKIAIFADQLAECGKHLIEPNYPAYRRNMGDCLRKHQSLFGDVEILAEAIAPFGELMSYLSLPSAKQFGLSVCQAHFDPESPVDRYERFVVLMDEDLDEVAVPE